MSFKDIRGQERAIKLLQKEMATSSVSGTYLFTGPAGVGKSLTALTFAKALNCKEGKTDSCDRCSSCRKIDHQNHPDVRTITPEKDSIKIEQTRSLKREIIYKLYEGRKKVWIIEKADSLTLEAANSLLKILEEPPAETVLILISPAQGKLLPTILSRCRIIRFLPLSSKEIEEIIAEHLPQNPEKIHLLARLARGKVGEALRLIKEEGILENREEILDSLGKERKIEEIFNLAAKWANYNKEELERILDMMLFWFRDLLILKQGGDRWLINEDKTGELKKQKEKYSFLDIKQIIEVIEKTRYYLKSNVNQRLALEAMWLKIAYSV